MKRMQKIRVVIPEKNSAPPFFIFFTKTRINQAKKSISYTVSSDVFFLCVNNQPPDDDDVTHVRHDHDGPLSLYLLYVPGRSSESVCPPMCNCVSSGHRVRDSIRTGT